MNNEKDCRNCKYGDTCATNYCDAVLSRAYNIRDGKDCWKANLIPMKNLKKRNVFEKNGVIEVAIDDAYNGYIWVTTPNYYNESGMYTYTSAALLPIEDINVRFIWEDVRYIH